MKSIKIRTLFVVLIMQSLVPHVMSAHDITVQTTVFSTEQYLNMPFVDSGWFGGIAGGFKIPIMVKTGLTRIGQTLISLDSGLSLGVLPASQGLYSGATIGIGIHYNDQMEGFYSAIYPMFDLPWLQIGKERRLVDWQSRFCILGFDLDLLPWPIQIAGSIQSDFAWIFGIGVPSIDVELAVGYHFNKQ